MRPRAENDVRRGRTILVLLAVVAVFLLVTASARPAEAQGLTIGGRGWSITFWSPPPSGGPGWYGQPGYAPGQPYWQPPSPTYRQQPSRNYGSNYGYGGEGRGSYSRDWNNRSRRWSEEESYRTEDGSYRRSTNCDPRRGCETRETVTRETWGPYTVPPPSRW